MERPTSRLRKAPEILHWCYSSVALPNVFAAQKDPLKNPSLFGGIVTDRQSLPTCHESVVGLSVAIRPAGLLPAFEPVPLATAPDALGASPSQKKLKAGFEGRPCGEKSAKTLLKSAVTPRGCAVCARCWRQRAGAATRPRPWSWVRGLLHSERRAVHCFHHTPIEHFAPRRLPYKCR